MKRSNGWITVLPSLVIPICFGLILYLGLLVLLERDFITNELALRYLTGHPISKLTLGLFCVGVASLILIADNVFGQFSGLVKISLRENDNESDSEGTNSTAPHAPNVVEQANRLTAKLAEMPAGFEQHYLWRRLNDSLNFITQMGSVRGIDQHQKHLAYQDQDFQEQRYSLLRILIWATPMLGFLGTVLGISAALGSIDVGPDNDFATMMGGLRGSLYVAFDTTALALSLSMILMFGQFLVGKFESQLLRNVESRTYAELAENFDLEVADKTVDSVERIGKTVLMATHEVVQKQADIWRESMNSAERAWIESIDGANSLASQNLEQAVDRTAENLAYYLGQTIDKADENQARRWEQWQVALGENARQLCEHQKELTSQTDLATQLLHQIQQVGENQHMVNFNLEALETSSELKSVLSSLEIAIEKLNHSVKGSIRTQTNAPSPSELTSFANTEIADINMSPPIVTEQNLQERNENVEPSRLAIYRPDSDGMTSPVPSQETVRVPGNQSTQDVLKKILNFSGQTTQSKKSA